MNVNKENEVDKNRWGGGDSQPSCGLFKLMPWLGTLSEKTNSKAILMFCLGLGVSGVQIRVINPSPMQMFQDLKAFETWDISVSKHLDKGHSAHAVLFRVSIFSIDFKVSLFWPSEFWLWCVECVAGEDFSLCCSFPRALCASRISQLMSSTRF